MSPQTFRNPVADLATILSRIRKLQALADSSQNDNVHQAAAAAAKIQSLLLQYNLTLEDVPLGVKEESGYENFVHEIHGSRRNDQWRIRLLSSICRNNFCKLILHGRTRTVGIVGRTQNIEVVMYLYAYLWREVIRLAKIYNVNGERAVHIDFCSGAVKTLSERLQEQRRQDTASYPTTTALVVQTDKELAEAVKLHYGATRSTSSRGRPMSSAFGAGSLAARTIDLRSGRTEIE